LDGRYGLLLRRLTFGRRKPSPRRIHLVEDELHVLPRTGRLPVRTRRGLLRLRRPVAHARLPAASSAVAKSASYNAAIRAISSSVISGLSEAAANSTSCSSS